MKNRFISNNIIKKVALYIITLLLSIIYLYLFNKNNSKIKNNEKYNLSSKILYSSLNRGVSYDEMVKNYSKGNAIKKVDKIIVDNLDNVNNDVEPLIYIYNTHESETYSLPFISDYSITPNVKIASYILKDYLNDFKIESIVEDKKIKDYLNKNKLDYSYSYQASRYYIKNELKKHDYKILIDLHRDSATKKYTQFIKDGKKYAKIMFVIGHNYDSYKYNEKFMNDLNERINKKYKGLSRGIFIRKNSRYNQDLSKMAILVELGGVDSTLEEINNTLYVFANILSEYINEEIYGRK